MRICNFFSGFLDFFVRNCYNTLPGPGAEQIFEVMRVGYFRELNWKRVWITLASVLVMGFSLATLERIDLGTDPYAFMNFTIADQLGWSLGNWQLLMNILLFIPVLLWGRDQIGLGTLFMMVLLGYAVDLSLWGLDLLGFSRLLEQDLLRVLLMLLSLAVFCFSAATYMSTGMGTSPCDAVAVILAHKLPKLPFKLVRFFYDLATLLIGVLCGGKLRIVTVLTVIFLGITIEFVAKKLFKRTL